MKENLKLRIFERFSLTDGEASVGEDTLKSGQITKLLAYLLLNRDSLLTHQRLIELFWENDSKNPEGALKNLMYRLRNELKVFGEEKYICTLPGAYQWNPKIAVETDYEELEQCAKDLKNSDESREEKKALCEKIMQCYRGNISPKLAEEAWILPKVVWYQAVYMDAVKLLCRIYEEEQDWVRLEMLCNQALKMDSFQEEIHCWLLKSLGEQKKYAQAIRHYESTRKKYYESMGIRELEQLKIQYDMVRSVVEEGYARNLEELVKELREEKPKGVFFCDFQVFRQIYQLESRRIDRLGTAEYVLLLTAQKQNQPWKDASVDEAFAKGIDILEKIIRKSLRAGDVAARCSQKQFIVMLPACTYEGGAEVAQRIAAKFKRSTGAKEMTLQYELAELSAVEMKGW